MAGHVPEETLETNDVGSDTTKFPVFDPWIRQETKLKWCEQLLLEAAMTALY